MLLFLRHDLSLNLELPILTRAVGWHFVFTCLPPPTHTLGYRLHTWISSECSGFESRYQLLLSQQVLSSLSHLLGTYRASLKVEQPLEGQAGWSGSLKACLWSLWLHRLCSFSFGRSKQQQFGWTIANSPTSQGNIQVWSLLLGLFSLLFHHGHAFPVTMSQTLSLWNHHPHCSLICFY